MFTRVTPPAPQPAKEGVKRDDRLQGEMEREEREMTARERASERERENKCGFGCCVMCDGPLLSPHLPNICLAITIMCVLAAPIVRAQHGSGGHSQMKTRMGAKYFLPDGIY